MQFGEIGVAGVGGDGVTVNVNVVDAYGQAYVCVDPVVALQVGSPVGTWRKRFPSESGWRGFLDDYARPGEGASILRAGTSNLGTGR